MADSEALTYPPHAPDPTPRTLETLHREIENVSERIETLIVSESRLTKSKFESVELQFALVERQRIEQKLDTKQAVDAALIAQKEAVGQQTIASEKSTNKSEIGTDAKIAALGASFTQGMAALTVSFNDLKDRVVAMEASGVGRQYERNEHRSETNKNVGIAYAAAGFGTLMATILGTYLAVHG